MKPGTSPCLYVCVSVLSIYTRLIYIVHGDYVTADRVGAVPGVTTFGWEMVKI